MRVNKQMALTMFMIVITCSIFFVLGYGYAVKKEVYAANVFIQDFLNDHVCIQKDMEVINYGNSERGKLIKYSCPEGATC